MYKVIQNGKVFREWCEKNRGDMVVHTINISGDKNKIMNLIDILDNSYGEGRDLEKDLGGYTIIIYGNRDEVQKTYKDVLHYHHLKEEEYEFEQICKVKNDMCLAIRLYIVSSDYNVVVVTIHALNID